MTSERSVSKTDNMDETSVEEDGWRLRSYGLVTAWTTGMMERMAAHVGPWSIVDPSREEGGETMVLPEQARRS